MSITDELREWAKTLTNWWYDPVKDEYTYTTGGMPTSIDAIRLDSNITAIADRIDAEHEAKVSYWQGASYKDGYDEGFASADDWLAQHEDAMSEHGWIRLPKDADGEYIHIGDEVEEVDYDGHASVFEVRMTADGWWVCAGGICRRPDRYRHYHAPTVEDVLREFANEVYADADNEIRDRDFLCAKYAKRLTLAETEDA